MGCAVPKIRANSRSVDWRTEQSSEDYSTLQGTTSEAYKAVTDLVEAFHVYADDKTREAFADDIGKLAGIGEALHVLSRNSGDTALFIDSINRDMDAAHKALTSTRSRKKTDDATRRAEDIRTEYVSRMDTAFSGTCPVWAAPLNDGSAQIKRVTRKSLSQDAVRDASPPHAVATGNEELARTVDTSVGRGDVRRIVALTITEEHSPLENVSTSQAQAHRVLAALIDQFNRIGWSTPIAVAVIERMERTRVVYTTVDGLSVLPRDVTLPPNTVPLSLLRAEDMSTVTPLYGQMYPVAKLLTGLDDSWTIKGLASNDMTDPRIVSDKAAIQDAILTNNLIEAKEIPPCTVRRGDLASVKPYQATAALTRARHTLGAESVDAKILAQELVAARWLNGEQPYDYLNLYMRWLMNDAHAALKAGNPSEATWSLSELEGLTL